MDAKPYDLDALLAHAGWARALARTLVRDEHVADDLVQRAWLAALRRPPSDSTPPRRWIATVMRNFARDDARDAARREQRERSVARREDVDLVGDAVAAHTWLVAAVDELPDPYRSAVWARYHDGLAPRAIAARDGVPVETVKSRIARGLAQLRERFDREHGGDRGAWIAALAPLTVDPSAPFVPLDAPVASAPLVASTLTTLVMDAKLKIAAVLPLVVCGSVAWFATRDGGAVPLAGGVEPSPALALAEPELRTAPRAVDGAAEARVAVAPHEAAPVAPIAAPVIERRGVVVDLEKRPVAGLAIVDGRERRPILVDDRPVRSDARGRFTVRAPVGLIAADGDGWTTLYSTRAASEDEADEMVVVVARERRVTGVVVDAAGAFVADAIVEQKVAKAVRLGLGELLRGPIEMAFTTRTDRDGRFELRAPDAEALLEARAENHRPGSSNVSGGDVDQVVITLPAPEASAITLRGRVVDERGAGVERATVVLAGVMVKSEADGSFALSVMRDALAAELWTTRDGTVPVEPMPLVLRAAKRGQLPAERGLPDLDELERIAPHETWRLELGGTPLAIDGRIVDSEGKPVAGARVYLIDTQPFGLVEVEVGNTSIVGDQSIEQFLTGAAIYQPGFVTRADGVFRFEGLQAREYRVDFAVHEIPATGTSAPIRAGTKGVDVVLDTSGPRADLAGRVVDRRGVPFAGARVHVAVTRPDSEDFIGGPSMETDAAGRFAFQRVRGSQFRLQIEHPEVIAQPLEVLPGDRFDELVVTVSRRSYVQVDLGDRPDSADAARFVDERGDAIEFQVSRTRFGDGIATSFSATTSELPIVAGRSEVASTAERDCTCVLTKDGVEVARIAVRLGGSGVTIVRP